MKIKFDEAKTELFEKYFVQSDEKNVSDNALYILQLIVFLSLQKNSLTKE